MLALKNLTKSYLLLESKVCYLLLFASDDCSWVVVVTGDPMDTVTNQCEHGERWQIELSSLSGLPCGEVASSTHHLLRALPL